MDALDKGNKNMIRYIVIRTKRIKKCVDSTTLAKVIQGDSKAVEKALKALLLCSWEGPIVRFLDEVEQEKVVINDSIFRKFIMQNREWIYPNTQVLAME